MAHSDQPRKVPGASAGKRKKPGRSAGSPDLGTDFRAHLDRGMAEAAKEGDWETWLHHALETGDPQFWPQIRKFYHEQPRLRQMILFHLPFYWSGHEPVVAPVFQEALRDPEQCDTAIRALEVFPSLSEDVLTALHNRACFGRVLDSLPQAVACLQQYPDQAVPLLQSILRDPVASRDFRSCRLAIQASSLFPELTDDVVGCLKQPEVIATVEPAVIVVSLAVLFGVTNAGEVDDRFERRAADPALWAGVAMELQRRYSLDLNQLVAAAYA
jgi:hypothetical protein